MNISIVNLFCIVKYTHVYPNILKSKILQSPIQNYRDKMDQLYPEDALQTKESLDQLRRHPSYTPSQPDYTTNINQLISQPNIPSKTEYFLATLYELSHYLFSKNVRRGGHDDSNASFDEYLNSVSREIGVYEGLHRRAKIMARKMEMGEGENSQELLQCYQRVPYAYFSQYFVLDFGQLAKNIDQIKKKQEQLNDDLDMVQINLFSQIHNKFHEYFKVVENLQYLNQSLQVNIQKNMEARASLNKVRVDFVEKSYKLKGKITHRQNIEKTVKLLKIIKSLKKLPFIIKQILESSLPYQCLSLLKSTKQSLQQVRSLKCLDKVSQTIRDSQSLVQMGLNKRYADELYMYLQQCQNVSLQEGWDRINSNNCVDLSGLNNSYMGISQIMEESVLDMQPTTSKNKRNQGKEFEIAMILLESYKYMAFPVDLIRIKVSNSLRIFSKKFDMELAECFVRILQEKNQKILQASQGQDKRQQIPIPDLKSPGSNEQQSALSGVLEKISVIFYVKHLFSFNQIMKDTLDRFLGYLHTLLVQFTESKDKDKDEQKFTDLFRQELSILLAISKITIQKLKMLMTLKNISGIGFNQFKQWVSVLEYWKRYTDSLIQSNPLINIERDNDPIQQAINDAFRKMVTIFAVNSTINQLVLNFITIYHSNAIESELQPSFVTEFWQQIEIPSQFVQVLNDIIQWHEPQTNNNISVTILNDSRDIKPANRSISQDYSSVVKKSTRFRVLKSNVMVDGIRYKISVSFLLLCQFINEYVKMARNLVQCRKLIYERMLNLIDYYNNRTKQLILQAKARQYQNMKNKNISAKQICLVHNCLSVLLKIVKQFNYSEVAQLKSVTVDNIQTHKSQLINKLSHLIRSKVESIVTNYFIAKDQKVAQVNLALLNVFVQMMGIIDDYLEFEDKRAVFKDAMEVFMIRYFKELLLKGAEYATENRILVEKMRFLRQYFPEELEVMEKELKSSSQSNID